MFVLTWHIFQAFGGKAVQPEVSVQGQDSTNFMAEIKGNIPFFYGLYICFLVIMTLFILRDWKKDFDDLIRIENSPGCKSVTGLILSNWIEVGLLAFMIVILIGKICFSFVSKIAADVTSSGFFHVTGGHKVLDIALIILTAILVGREILQLTVSIKRYICSPENWIEVGCIILIGIIVFYPVSSTLCYEGQRPNRSFSYPF